MKIVILPSAMEDLDRGYEFYETCREGLGDYFQESLFADIDSLHLFGGAHQIINGYYRVVSKRFPFATYYTITSGSLHVHAVLDCRQNPARNQSRMYPLENNAGIEGDCE